MKTISFESAIEKVNKETDIIDLFTGMITADEVDWDVIKQYNPNLRSHINELAELNSGGGRWISTVGLCHDTENKGEKFDTQDNRYACFACGHNWDVIQLYMYLKKGVNPKLFGTKGTHGREFRASVHELAAKLGYKVLSVKRTLSKKERDEIKKFDILDKSLQLYVEQYQKSDVAKAYVEEERALNAGPVSVNDVAKKLRFGFAPEPFPSDWLYNQLKTEFTTEELVSAGVVKWVTLRGEEKVVDFHSYGITMGYEERGRWTNIYSRAMDYVRSDGTKVNVHKDWRHLRLPGSVDVPINFHEAIRHEVVNLVEGEFSLGAALILDYPNTMGNRGTNGLQKHHVDMLVDAREKSKGHLVKKVRIVFDNDKAGIKAAIKTGKLLTDAGFEVEVVILPKDEDPNDILVNNRDKAKSLFDKMYSEAVSYEAFCALKLINKEDVSYPDKLKQYRLLKKFISDNGSKLDDVEMKIIAKEYSDYAKVPFEDIWEAWKPTLNKNVEAFYSKKSVVLTKDERTFYRAEIVFGEKMVYAEDTTMSFLDKEKELSIHTILADKEAYTSDELEMISYFCKNHNLRFLTMDNMLNAHNMSTEEMQANILDS